MFKKILSVFLALVLLCSLISGCTENGTSSLSSEPNISSDITVDSDISNDSELNSNSNVENSENEQYEDVDITNGWETEITDPYADSKKINFYVDQLFNFNIVRPNNIDDNHSQIVKSTIFKTARAINRKRPNYLTDADNLNTGLKSIYIGDTNHPYSKEAKKLLNSRDNNYYDYIIIMNEGNLFINAVTSEGLQLALDYFCTQILIDLDSTIPENYKYHYQHGNDSISPMKIADFDISQFAIICSKFPTGMEKRGAEELQSAIKSYTKMDIPVICGDAGSYEHMILLKENEKDRNNYSLKVSDGDLIISGGHDYSLNAAIHLLAMNIKSIPSDKSINIPKDFSHTGVYSENTKGTDTYQLVWADEFDGDSYNTEFWKANDYMRYNTHRSPESIAVSDGYLTITSWAEKLDDGTDGYISGELEGKNVDFSYGYFEIRAKLPRGHGNWTSFWACGKNTADNPFRAEIDVFEAFGHDGVLTSNLHSWWNSGRHVRGLAYTEAEKNAGHIGHLGMDSLCITNSIDGGNKYTVPGIESLADDWHTYGCEWTPSFMKFYCDGICYTEVNLESLLIDSQLGYRTSPFLMFTNGRPVNIILGNLLDAPDAAIGVDETTELPSKYIIDYVHLYQIEGIGGIHIKE